MDHRTQDAQHADIAVIGAGAAGLMAAIWAGRSIRNAARPARIVLLDGAKTLGAKILVAGGGRCNVTHDQIDPSLYAGSSVNAIRKVLLRFDVPQVTDFFRELDVTLKREPTGKLFPTTDRARTVLDALLLAARDAGVEIIFPWRVESVASEHGHFVISRSDSTERIIAQHAILATGGMSLPKSGSDGHGHAIARALGHSITQPVHAALVPLIVAPDDPVGIREISGVAADALLEVRSSTNKRLISLRGSTLCTHFGLSGPGPMDISRHLIRARKDDKGATLVLNWTPDLKPDALDHALLHGGRLGVARLIRDIAGGLPERLVLMLCKFSKVDPSQPARTLRREQRIALVRAITECTPTVSGDRGWNAAEVTAGGVPLTEIKLKTMESRFVEHLHLCGEICDVDGRIGGYNFQWAWASGFVAGSAAGNAIANELDPADQSSADTL